MSEKLSGKITQGVGGLYSVRILTGEPSLLGKTLTCRARGALKHNNISLLVGDNVTLSPIRSNEPDKNIFDCEYVVDTICERKNALIRPPIANLDYIFITLSAAAPSPILSNVDKLISISEFNKIEPIIVITKCELDPVYSKTLTEIYEKSGFTVFCLSALEQIAVEPIDEFIKSELTGKLAAFAGASGIGKSTLLNRLFPTLSLSTSEISQKIQRGKHTTRKVEIFPVTDNPDSVNCGYIADTPGFSMLDFERFDFFEKDDLIYTMRDFTPFIGSCKYKKCSHTKEEGCSILQAVKDGIIAKSRHDSYCELYNVLKSKTKW